MSSKFLSGHHHFAANSWQSQILLLSLCMFVSRDAHSQTIKEFRQELDKRLDRLETTDSGDFDERLVINENLLQYLLSTLPNTPESLSYSFNFGGANMTLGTSADHRLRIWA